MQQLVMLTLMMTYALDRKDATLDVNHQCQCARKEPYKRLLAHNLSVKAYNNFEISWLVLSLALAQRAPRAITARSLTAAPLRSVLPHRHTTTILNHRRRHEHRKGHKPAPPNPEVVLITNTRTAHQRCTLGD